LESERDPLGACKSMHPRPKFWRITDHTDDTSRQTNPIKKIGARS
jgi:hypothetical protein